MAWKLQKCLQYGWQNFVFVIHSFSKSGLAFLYCNHPYIHGKENKIIVAKSMQQEHIQWQLKQDQILHMQQQADDWQNFSKKQAANARAQRLSPVGRMTWWKKGRKWRCHNNAQWQNDIQEKSIMEPGKTKIQFYKQT